MSGNKKFNFPVIILFFLGYYLVYVYSEERDANFINDSEISLSMEDNETDVTTVTTTSKNSIDFYSIMEICNSSFSILMDEFVQFNTTGDLPDIINKTGMCYIRCLYEKSGLIENWRLNADKIRENIWPATGDSIEYCQHEGSGLINPCDRVYAIARCLVLRAIVDARNKPTV